jgi:hypothetical protein
MQTGNPDGGSLLSATEGQELKSAFNQFLDQIPEIDEARRNVDLGVAREDSRAVFDREKIIFYCNGLDALLGFPEVVESGPELNGETAEEAADARLKEVQALRGVEDTICKV